MSAERFNDAFAYLKARLLSLYPADFVPPEQLYEVEKTLGIVLPADLKALSAVYAGGMLGGVDHYDIGNTEREFSVTAKTIALRHTIPLPHEYIALAEPPVSMLLMQTQGSAELSTPIVWLDAIDLERYILGGAYLGTPPEVFSSYAEFFCFLLEREEQERAEL